MNKNEKGFSAVELIALLFVVGLIVGTGWYVWKSGQKTYTQNASQQSEQPIASPAPKYVAIRDWHVRFATGKVDNFSYALPTQGIGSTPDGSFGGPADLESVYIAVTGFTKEQNKCLEKNGKTVVGLGYVARHKDQNPSIRYGNKHQLNAKAQVKIGDWYYSTDGLTGDGNCFEGVTAKPIDYAKLQTLFLENFNKLKVY